MIDTHCHLADPRLFEQVEAVLQRAADAGVSRILTIGTRLADSRRCVELAHRYPQVRAVVGCHPHEAGKTEPHEIEQLAELARDSAVVAVGEMGLDYHYDFASRLAQRTLLLSQLAAFAPLNKPLVIHCREAIDDCLAILRDLPGAGAGVGASRGVFHCFTGTSEEAGRILAAGFHLSFTGVLTFKNPGDLRAIAQSVPADRFFVETDAPWLSPEPFRRQKINEPSLLPHTLLRLAELRGMAVEELDELTTANAQRLFSLGPAHQLSQAARC